jgi:hypothetical protein
LGTQIAPELRMGIRQGKSMRPLPRISILAGAVIALWLLLVLAGHH